MSQIKSYIMSPIMSQIMSLIMSQIVTNCHNIETFLRFFCFRTNHKFGWKQRLGLGLISNQRIHWLYLTEWIVSFKITIPYQISPNHWAIIIDNIFIEMKCIPCSRYKPPHHPVHSNISRSYQLQLISLFTCAIIVRLNQPISSLWILLHLDRNQLSFSIKTHSKIHRPFTFSQWVAFVIRRPGFINTKVSFVFFLFLLFYYYYFLISTAFRIRPPYIFFFSICALHSIFCTVDVDRVPLVDLAHTRTQWIQYAKNKTNRVLQRLSCLYSVVPIFMEAICNICVLDWTRSVYTTLHYTTKYISGVRDVVNSISYQIFVCDSLLL